MHIHILAIAGVMTAPLACYLQSQGHQISGSDQDKVYPPISTMLKKAKININTQAINSQIDLVIVGSSYKLFKKSLEEFAQIKKLKIPYISATKYIAQNIAQKNSILVAGAYGKSTTAGLLIQILKNAKLNPSYMLGAKGINKMESLSITDSDWSVIEADESINGLDTKAKFLYYPVKHAIITSTDWEHKESYPNHQANLDAYQKLIQKIPPDGFLIYNPQDKHLQKLSHHCVGQTFPCHSSPTYPSSLLGSHNQENINASATLSQKLGINPAIIKKTIKNYKGLKRRLEIIKSTKNIIFIDDFAQSAPRIKAALQTIKKTFPRHIIKVFLEPHASFLQNKKSLPGLASALALSSEVILSKIKYSIRIDKKDRSTASDFKSIIGPKLIYQPLYPQIQQYYLKTLRPQQILVHFSSGGQTGLKTFHRIASLIDKQSK